MFNKTVTAKAFVANPSNKTASITNGGLKTFSTETEYDSENGLMRSERRGKEESEKSKFACSAFSKAQNDNLTGLKTHSNGIDLVANSTDFSEQPFKSIFSSLHDRQQSYSNAQQRKALCSNSTATANKASFVHSVSQYQTERDKNCFLNHQTLEAKNGDYIKTEGVIYKPFSCNNHLDSKRNNSEKFPFQLRKEKKSILKDAATMTTPDHKNRLCMVNHLKSKEFRSKGSQTVVYHNYSSQRKTLISKSVEAKLHLPLKHRPQRISVSCQACVELAPANNFWRQICLPNNLYKNSILKPNADYLAAFPPCSASSKTYNHSNSVRGRISRTLECEQQIVEEHYPNFVERGLYPTDSRGAGIGADHQGQLYKVVSRYFLKNVYLVRNKISNIEEKSMHKDE